MEELEKTILPTKFGEFEMMAFASEFPEFPHVVLMNSNFNELEPLVRIHSECMTGDLFSSKKCDCGDQLNFSLKEIGDKGGVFIYLRQEGRGIGLVNKMKAYNLQAQGKNTIEANLELGFDADSRDFQIAIEILKMLKIDSVQLMTNNPEKMKIFEHSDISIKKRISIEGERFPENEKYLQTKRDSMGHLFNK